VTALDSGLAPAREDGIALNDWTARELGARVGDTATLEYYVWRSDARLHTGTAQFRVERIVPLSGDAADPDLAPQYPGITESRSFRDWDPPFPLDLTRIRPADEQYWNRYRTTPKAFVRLARGRQLWGTRFGSLTSIRVFPPSPAFAEALRTALDPALAGLTVVPVARGEDVFDERALGPLDLPAEPASQAGAAREFRLDDIAGGGFFDDGNADRTKVAYFLI